MPDCQSDADRSTSVARCGLDPNIFKGPFAQDAAVGDAVERHSARHTETLQPRFLVHISNHLEHRFFSNGLDAAGKIHFALSDF